MKIKKLLLFTLLIQVFLTETILPAQPNQQGQEANNVWMSALLMGASIASHIASAYSGYAQGNQLIANTEITQATEKDRPQKTEDETRQAKVNINNSMLTAFKEAQSSLRGMTSDPQAKKELERINKAIENHGRFLRTGNNDKEIFDPKINYQPKDQDESNKDLTESEIKKPNTPKPDGKFKQAAAFIAATTVGAADRMANALPINAGLNLAQKDSFIDTHKLIIGRATAAIITAATLGALYKAYQWYTNEDRLLACETVIELEAKQKEIAAQFKKEIEKATLSAEEKAKLIKAYENYMDELQEEIDEQKIVAGHGVAKKVAMGLIAATGGIAGLHALTQYYFNKPIDVTTNTKIELQQDNTITTTTTENQPTESVQTENVQPPVQSDTPDITTPVMPEAQQLQTENPKTKVTVCEQLLPASIHDYIFGTLPEQRKEIDHNLTERKQQEKVKDYAAAAALAGGVIATGLYCYPTGG